MAPDTRGISPVNRVVIKQIIETQLDENDGGDMGPKIGSDYLPIRNIGTWNVAWDEKTEFQPMAGLYDVTERAATMGQLPISSKEADMLHFSARAVLDMKELHFLRLVRNGPIDARVDYGTGMAADDVRQRDAETIQKKVEQMGVAMANSLEYLQFKAMLGRLVWPPKDANGADITAATMPRQFGQMAVNQAFPFVTANATTSDGGYHQPATTLVGIGGVAGTQVAWNNTGADAIADLDLIFDLMDERSGIQAENSQLLTSKRVFRNMSSQTAVLNRILGQSRDRYNVTTREVRDELATEWDFTVRFYNSRWQYVDRDTWGSTSPTINTVPFMPAGTVLIIPRPSIQNLGEVLSGPAPGPLYTWDSGMYSWAHADQGPPWGREIGVGRWQWPVVVRTNKRFRLDAFS